MKHAAIRLSLALLAAPLLLTNAAAASWPDLPEGGFRFFTFVVTWTDEDTPEFMAFLREARPEVVQVGFYGPMFHGYAFHEESTGYPMRLPVAGERAALDRQTEINAKVRELGSKVIGHFQMSAVVANPDEPFGFIKWYNEHWDEDLLGPKPVDDVRELLQRDAAGDPITQDRYINFAYLCISSPHTRDLMKRMVKIAVDAGVDGLMSNYNYRKGCVCHWCQDAFKTYLRQCYDADTLRERFGIAELDSHTFDRIFAHMPGYPDPETATELDWAAMDWGYRHFKQVFDEVLIDYGRSLKSDLLIGTWNHVGLTVKDVADVRTVGEVEERTFTPLELWHRGENYFWYSGSHGNSNLAEKHAGDAWLNLLWLREMVEGKPFMIGKYVRGRIRVALAEGVATGGAGTGLRHPITSEAGREAMTRHHKFVHQHRELYAQATPRAEVGLVLPRQSVLNRQPDAYDAFRTIGETLAQRRMLFDVVLDERLSAERLAGYSVLVLPAVLSLSDEQRSMIRDYVEAGGAALIVGDLAVLDEQGQPRPQPGIFASERLSAAGAPVSIARGRGVWLPIERAAEAIDQLAPLTVDAPLSTIGGSWKVRAAAFDLPDGMTLHLVNYDRDEQAGGGEPLPKFESPIAVRDLPVELNLPEGARVASVTLRSPDHEQARELEHVTRGGRLRFTVPEIEVYGVIEIRFAR